jgi:hypothetical protein
MEASVTMAVLFSGIRWVIAAISAVMRLILAISLASMLRSFSLALR